MNSRHLVDPELIAGLDLIPNFQLSADTLAAVRANPMMPLDEPDTGGPAVSVEEHFAEGPDGNTVRLMVYRPAGGAAIKPGYFHIHGGGYLLGSPEMNDPNNRAIARELDCIVASVDYRVAPETPHPGPVEDCYAGLAWFHRQAAAFGIDANRIAIGGESAGGGLAAALCLLARDRAKLPVCFQYLVYPMIDDRTGTSLHHPYAGEFVWTAQSNVYGWTSLLGHEPGIAGVSPYAAASRAESLAGLPPTFLACGAIDLFIDENLDYARRLIHAGVPTEVHVYPGAFHAFQRIQEADVTRRFYRDSMDAMRRGLA